MLLVRGPPRESLSTGSDSDTITSHYEHLLGLYSEISGHAANLAVTGEDVLRPLPGGRSAADVRYVTILLGANDIGTSSSSTMTPTATFGTQFRNTLYQVHAKAANALVFVSSIPNVFQLWSTLRGNLLARLGPGQREDLPRSRPLQHGGARAAPSPTRDGTQQRPPASTCTSAAQRLLPADNFATFNVAFTSETGEHARLLPPERERPGRVRANT